MTDFANGLADNNLDDFIVYFADVCQEIVQLAEEIGEPHWAVRFFRPAALALNNKQLNIEQKLIKSIEYTQVFGGMGSWLDSPPFSAEECQKRDCFERLTDELYHCRKRALKLIHNNF